MTARDARDAEIAENPRAGVALLVAVLAEELSGPRRGAPVAVDTTSENPDKSGNSTAAEDSSGAGGAGWTGVAAVAGAGAPVVVAGGLVCVRGRRGAAERTTRGSA
ncbi:hypothetical protein PUR28_30720 [Streptomyces sp. BE308]|uniref:hypothetical protein n=1 Tax=Streptomyces sp. BE308 TaxID=3002529 RepID=UPI002E77559D|nr:hypothetical protein [Streptomyces sp. BE308]MEE1795097.1 hypothetical protein [Streptomyces sp. BE308]